MKIRDAALPHSLTYRPEIDGLRAFAVLAVVIYHAFPQTIRNGFIGVDVFFVISGYLICGVILKDLERDKFSFSTFYFRRIRRIFPALILVLATTLFLGWFLLFPHEFEALGKHVFGGAAFISNLLLWKESGYFDVTAKAKPLLHLWSLGIEEQFYIVFPWLLYFSTRKKIRPASIIAIFTILSFAYNIYIYRNAPIANFFSPFSRAWEMLAGALLFALMRRHDCASPAVFAPYFSRPGEQKKSETLSLILAVLGLILFIVALSTIKATDRYPGWKALFPVTGTLFFIAAGSGNIVSRFLLTNRVSVFIGLISYPLYLWHWIFISFAFIITKGLESALFLRFAIVAISLILSTLTYYFVEKPIRYSSKISKKYITIGLTSTMAIIALSGLYIWLNRGIPSRFPDPVAIIKSQEAAGEWEYPEGMFESKYDGLRYYYNKTNSGNNTVLFVGDSNIEQYWPRVRFLQNKFRNEAKNVIFVTGGGSIPIPGMQYELNLSARDDYAGKAFRLMKENNDIDTIVIAASWNGYFTGKGRGLEKFNINDGSAAIGFDRLQKYIKSYTDNGKKVIFLLTIPQDLGLDPAFLMGDRNITNFPNIFTSQQRGGVDRKILEEKYSPIRDALINIGNDTGALVIDPFDLLCSDERCEAVDENGEPMYKDSSHLRPSYVRNRVTFLDSVIVPGINAEKQQ